MLSIVEFENDVLCVSFDVNKDSSKESVQAWNKNVSGVWNDIIIIFHHVPLRILTYVFLCKNPRTVRD